MENGLACSEGVYLMQLSIFGDHIARKPVRRAAVKFTSTVF